jgi:DNA-binding response OmpR family regulator
MEHTHILVVDDDRDLVESIKIYLEARDFDVSTAHNGREAYSRIVARRPDLIVLDIMMDYDEEGMVFASALRTDGPTHDIPIIFLSGFDADQETKEKVLASLMGQEMPGDVFFQKPVRLRELTDYIGTLLARPRVSKAPTPQPWPAAVEA